MKENQDAFCSNKKRCATIITMRDTLDVSTGKSRIGRPLAITLCSVLCVALIALLVVRKAELRQAEEEAQVNAQNVQQVTGEELFPSLYGEEETSESEEGVAAEEIILPPNTYELPDEETVTFTFAGDVLLDESYAVMSTFRANGSVLENCIDPALLDIMQGADVFMVNNEFTYTDRGEPIPDKAYTFRADPENVAILQEMGVDIVSLANNHAYDYGEISLLDTLDTLESAGIPYVGAGRDLEEAAKVVYFRNDTIKIGIVSATEVERMEYPDTRGATEDTPGTFRCFRNDLLEEVIREAKKECDFLIVYVHWGTESTDQLDWSQPGQAEAFTEAGADVIIGAHPHVLQEVGYVNEVPVFYSLGNYWFNSKSLDSCLVTLEIGADGLVSAQFVPCLTQGSKTTLATGSDAERVLNYMRNLSDGVAIDGEGYVSPQDE